jgi:ERCC4-type nuclease
MSKAKPVPTFTVIRDTQEKVDFWEFPAAGPCLGTIDKRLPTGDYTLAGYEKTLCIERKRNMGELAGNLTEERFHRELERLEAFPLPLLVCEFPFADVLSFPLNSGIPEERWPKLRVTANYLLNCLNQILVKHRTRIIYAGSHEMAKRQATSLFKRVVENVKPDCGN